MIWNYGFSLNEMYETYCGFLTCITPSWKFKKGEKYPFYCKNGYANIVIIDMKSHKAVVYQLDCYEDNTFKIVGADAELENAVFMERG